MAAPTGFTAAPAGFMAAAPRRLSFERVQPGDPQGAPSPDPPARGDPPEPQSFGHFRLLKELGRGAQGVVWLAEDTLLRRKVALKMLLGSGLQSKATRDRFEREAKVASRLEHPGICGVHEVGEVDGVPYMSMQYLRGTTLAARIEEARAQRRGESTGADPTTRSLADAASLPEVLRILESTARALHAAHEAGLLHRDVKPANVMITPDGNPVILDFGLARDVADQGNTLTETGAILGTPAYLAPEQIVADRAQIDRRTDVYALGVALYECLTLERPFEAKAFDQLFHQILHGTPKNPRSLNQRIPRELGTVIEVAMERDRGRRYASALDFAEDLRRIRAFEPIRAQAPGPWTRLRKWSQRKPAQAVAAAAAALFLLVAAGTLATQAVIARRVLRDHLVRAERLHAQGDFAGALEAVAAARERDPGSNEALELTVRLERERDRASETARREADLAAARAAREESAGLEARHAVLRDEIVALSRELEQQRPAVFAAFATDQARGAFARKEQELAQRSLEAERLLQSAREALELAARREAPWGRTPETEAAFTGFYLARWREALASKDAARAEVHRAALERSDARGLHRAEILGRGSLRVVAAPADAELRLFRHEPYQGEQGENAVPRLVPTPTSGIGSLAPDALPPSARPGVPCVAILAVAEGSPAQAAGLRAGDLVVACNGQRADGGAWLVEARDDRVADAGVALPARVAELGGAPVENLHDWTVAPPPSDGLDRVGFGAPHGTVAVARDALRVVDVAPLGEQGSAGSELVMSCLRAGRELELRLPPGTPSGIDGELDAYPLLLLDANRVEAATAFEVDAGSYLLDVRCDGFEPQRVPVRVDRHGDVEVAVELLSAGSTPRGFAWVAPGPFPYGGDPAAREPQPVREVELPGFFVARRELTNREWREFLDDPGTRARIAASAQPIYVPRDAISGPMPAENLGGPDTPVMGVSWEDVRDYLAWRNARALQRGEPWTYALPTEEQWEKAARGVDGRAFPWGDRFDFANVVGLYHRPHYLHDAPGACEPRDASPYGVRDLAGHRQEWTADVYVPAPDAPPLYRWRGGAWLLSNERDFRCASRGFGRSSQAAGNLGFRLVAARRP